MVKGREFLVEIVRAIGIALGVPIDPILMLMRGGEKSEGQDSGGS